jgi:hypothetical protein
MTDRATAHRPDRPDLVGDRRRFCQRWARRQIRGPNLPGLSVVRQRVQPRQVTGELGLPRMICGQDRGVTRNSSADLEGKMRHRGTDEHGKFVLGWNAIGVLENGHGCKATRPIERQAGGRRHPEDADVQLSLGAMSRPRPEPLWQ